MEFKTMLKASRSLSELRSHDRWSPEKFGKYQGSELAKLRSFVYAHSSFYRKFHRNLEHRPLAELPILTKTMVMEHFDEIVTDRSVRLTDVERHMRTYTDGRVFGGRYVVNSSSGTTGRRGWFLFDEAEWSMLLAGYGRAASWAGLNTHSFVRRKGAMVASTTPSYQSARINMSTSSWLYPTMRMDASEPPHVIITRLNDWQPYMLSSYPSTLNMLAGEQTTNKRLHIAPRIVTASGEVVTEELRAQVQAAWGCALFNGYSATESGMIAAECRRHAGLHVAEDMVIIEVVDEEGHAVPTGTFGARVLITVLHRRTQPLIRYEMSDLVRFLPQPCPCGLPYRLIDNVDGRRDEVLRFPSSNGETVAIHPNALRRVVESVTLSGWELLLDHDGLHLTLAGVPNGFDESVLTGALRREVTAQGASMPVIHVRQVDKIERGATGKAPMIRSNISK